MTKQSRANLIEVSFRSIEANESDISVRLSSAFALLFEETAKKMAEGVKFSSNYPLAKGNRESELSTCFGLGKRHN
jgi:hypothetical protein